ncbi:gliding motility protein GldN [Flavitalea sp. BT771]|uniref:type IX secretion system ring protein PorN/GldN n=1 Tax=Flavitalea sp. BT771 TaxID=3063329 RepID=UPI0026E129C0|nr:gliding motility protein GldN [Flavitalea sp. BT771]MDO6434073.1 gliding motility protein GldN [Flavitalea sp. BT771]MDV6222973.1 gliding motility protein GldN [Flavitalea sp. BT771]
MKKHFIRLCLLALVVALAAGTADAQTTRKGKKRPPAKKSASTKSQGGNNAAVAPVKDTVKPAPVADADIKLVDPLKSLRNDAIIERNLVKDRTPLTYEHIREDDAVYRQRVWREIDVHEKMNLPFVYKATEDNGNQRFIYILLNGIKAGNITAFDANVDDRFTTPMTFQQIANGLVGKPQTIQIPDPVNDPDGSKGTMKDTTITQEFNPDAVERYQIKEEWVFDKESSRLHVRILGIAPEKTILNPDGSFRAVLPIFWVYYPEIRPILAKFEAYNGKNFGARMSWEELFESRMFASRIIKSTVDNPGDQFISGYIRDPILQLLEGENIKEKIFNYEQDLWSY